MRTLVENCFALSTKLLKKDLHRARNNESVQNEYLNFIQKGRPSVLFYSIDYSFDGNTYLVVTFDAEPQKILLSTRELTFGTRSYLVCPCGQKTNTLYLKNVFFACFKCHSLRYQSMMINSNTDHGRMLYLHNKRLELADIRENIPRPLYRSNWTKPFKRYLKLCVQAGLFQQVMEAQNTMEAIKKYQSQ